MNKLLKNITADDLEKLKTLLSIIPNIETKEIITLRVFENEYCNMIKVNRSKAYYISVCSSFKHLIMYLGSGKSISIIGLKEVEKFSSYLQQNVTNGYRVYFRTLKAAFNKAVDWGYVNVNHFQKVKLPKKQQVNPVFINSDQLSAISNQINNEVIKDFVVFGFYTGMRLNEIINLTWRNVDLSAKVITVGDDKFTTKGRNQRFIPICEEAFEALLRMKSAECGVKNIKPIYPSGISHQNQVRDKLLKKRGDPSALLRVTNAFVFCKNDGSKYCGNYVSRKFKDACTAAGMDHLIHFHSLRHSFASNLVQKGVPLYTIKELLGHSSISTTEIYSHLNMDTLREAIKKLDNRPHPDSAIMTAEKPLLSKERGISPPKIFRINAGEKR